MLHKCDSKIKAYGLEYCMVLNGKKNFVVNKNVNMLFTCTI